MKNNSITCDILIIGAGPAGSTAARVAAQQGVKVILLERRESVGLPVRCAEYVPLLVSRYTELKDPGISVQPVGSMQTYVEGVLVNEMAAPGLMINRDRFDQKLADLAVEAGAELKTGIQAWGWKDGQVMARRKSEATRISSMVIIGADGPSSLVSRWMGNRLGDYLAAAQARVPLKKSLDHTRVYFEPAISGGYGWLFPKGEIANLGVGIDPSQRKRLPEILKKFKGERVSEGLIGDEILGSRGGLVPVGGLTRVWKENMILAGDAAGTCHPITGAGVGNALISGEMAGQAAAEAIRKGNLRSLQDYEQELAGHLGHSLNHAAGKRKNMIARWNQQEFSTTIRQSWIAFKEYYRDP